MNKPHLRKCEDSGLWHCSLQRREGFWHEFGYTWQTALEKMQARLARLGQ